MFKLNKRVAEALQRSSGRKLKAREIAEWIFQTYPTECAEKKARSKFITTDAELVQQLVAEIGANRPAICRSYPQVRTTEGRPRLYYWTEATEAAEVAEVEPTSTETSLTPVQVEREAMLYPKLAEFLSAEFGIHTKRIDEKRSSNRRGPQGNRWLYPDLVSMENLTAEWVQEVRDCVSQVGARKARLWSFEVKVLINRSNVREAYFQAVSNSSWANFGYLVAAEIEGSDTLKEVRMLAALHGIGIIRLDAENPPESEILIPARERPEVDWANCNRLAAENKDFSEVITLVRQFHQTGDPRPRDWDA